MKTLADFKRRLVPGMSLTTEFPGYTIRGNLGDTVAPPRTVTRKVHAVTPGKVVFEKEGQPGVSGSNLHWPKADCLTFSPCGLRAAVADVAGGKPFAVYVFAEEVVAV
jgi:hypothetical protein